MKKTICPQCKTEFNASEHRAYKGLINDQIELIQEGKKSPELIVDESSFVKCPSCKNEFKSESVRFFWFLSPAGMKIFIALFVSGFFFFALWVIISSLKNY